MQNYFLARYYSRGNAATKASILEILLTLVNRIQPLRGIFEKNDVTYSVIFKISTRAIYFHISLKLLVTRQYFLRKTFQPLRKEHLKTCGKNRDKKMVFYYELNARYLK